MLKQLSNRLHLFLAGILMVIITLILCFSLWNMYQSQQLADISLYSTYDFPNHLSVGGRYF